MVSHGVWMVCGLFLCHAGAGVCFDSLPEGGDAVFDGGDGGGEFGGGGAVGKEVVFDFWFCAAGAYGEAASVREVDEEHFFCGDGVSFGIGHGAGGEVSECGYGCAVHGCGRVFDVAFGEGCDFCCAVCAFHDDAFTEFFVVAELGVDVVEALQEAGALGGEVGVEFCEAEGCGVGVFIAHEVLGEVAVAFFAAEDEVFAVPEAEGACLFFCHAAVALAEVFRDGLFVFAEFRSDVFEACEDVDGGDAEGCGDGVLQGAGDKGFDHGGVREVFFRDEVEFSDGFAAVPCHEAAGLVAGEELHFAGGFVAYGDAHAVGIGVCGDDEVCVFRICLGDGHVECGGVFRVGAGDGGEAAVQCVLSGDGGDVAADFAEEGDDAACACAVEVGKDDFCGCLGEDVRAEDDAFEAVCVDGVEFGAEDAEGALGVFGEGGEGVGGEGVYFCDDGFVVRGDELCSVVKVCFEAVVVGGVVGCGDDDAGICVKFSDGEGDFRCGAGAIEEGAVAAEGGGDAGAEFGEVAGEVAGVVTDDDEGFAAGCFLFDKAAYVGDEAAHGSAYVKVVHGGGTDAGELGAVVGTTVSLFCGGDDGADGATPETTCAEGECFEEAVVEFCPFLFFDELGDGCGDDGVRGAGGEESDVFQGCGEEFSLGDGLFQSCEYSGIHHMRVLYALGGDLASFSAGGWQGFLRQRVGVGVWGRRVARCSSGGGGGAVVFGCRMV